MNNQTSALDKSRWVLRDKLVIIIIPILVSIFTWAFLFLIDLSKSLPIVEYSVTVTNHNNTAKEMRINIQNLSNKHTFGNLKFSIASRAEKPGKFTAAGISAFVPYSEGKKTNSKITSDQAAAHYEIEILHPNSEYELSAEYIGIDVPDFRLLNSDVPIMMVESSFGSLLIKNIIWIIGAIAITVGILIILMICIGIGLIKWKK